MEFRVQVQYPNCHFEIECSLPLSKIGVKGLLEKCDRGAWLG